MMAFLKHRMFDNALCTISNMLFSYYYITPVKDDCTTYYSTQYTIPTLDYT